MRPKRFVSFDRLLKMHQERNEEPVILLINLEEEPRISLLQFPSESQELILDGSNRLELE